ncbi:MAG: DNA mismatch repair endonuclease MutL [Firmicutes bacterium]|nr:DNA mismatch repair endonuclease MutL [Bacillota bacterium]
MLEENTANKIAAGEVIERPASVVKELVENALDAGATAIEVEIREGGKDYIRVVDNGRGIPGAEVPLAFERHGTSKIRQAEDLFHILTLGFRGEALPSIAAVSDMIMCTKTADAAVGTLIAYQGGKRTRLEAVGTPVGTGVTVKDLFFNIPARYKFLNQAASERRYVYDILGRIALANPAVRFRLISDEEEILMTPGDGQLETVMWNIYGGQVGKNLLPIHGESNYLAISGLVCKPEIHRGNRQAETFIVNGRVIDSPLLASALEKGYQTMLPRRRFPIAVVCINIDPTRIDVNVHPAKREVRFSDSSEIYKQVMFAVRRALASTIPFSPWQLAPSETEKEPPESEQDQGTAVHQQRFSMEPQRTVPKQISTTQGMVARHQDYARKPVVSRADTVREIAGDKVASPVTRAQELSEDGGVTTTDQVPTKLHQEWRVLGQFQRTYMLVDMSKELWLVDQHVAHERVLYERFQGQLLDGHIQSQVFLMPQHLELGVTARAAIGEWIPRFRELGFEVEEFGSRDCLVRAVPYELSQISSAELAQLLLGILEKGLTEDYREEALVLMCCKGAVKAGESLTIPVMEELLESLFATDNPFTCPHGRPVVVRLAIEDIHRRFGRL